MDLVARGTGVVAGVPVAAAVFEVVSGGDAEVDALVRRDGDACGRGDVLLTVTGPHARPARRPSARP